MKFRTGRKKNHTLLLPKFFFSQASVLFTRQRQARARASRFFEKVPPLRKTNMFYSGKEVVPPEEEEGGINYHGRAELEPEQRPFAEW